MLALVTYLALEARQPSSLRGVAFALWPDLDEDDALATYRRAGRLARASS